MKLEDFLIDNKPKVMDVKYFFKKIKEKQDCVLLFLDNDERILISIESYFEKGISNLKGIDENLYLQLKDEERLLIGYNSCLRKLSCKDYSVQQIKDYLYTKKELHRNDVDQIINKLIKYGLLDDEKYTINRVSYLNKQLFSIKQIKNKLNKEGIQTDLIEKYVINNSEEEYKKICRLVEKYSNGVKNKSSLTAKQAILSKLMNAGFNYDLCKCVIELFDFKNENEFELLRKEFNKANVKYSKKYSDYDLKKHIYSYLLNKGFKSEDIKKVIGG